jgi:Protein of unknown function (DUF1573)
MKYLLSIVFMLFAMQSINAQSNNLNGAKFKFTQETHDFGNLKEGDEAVYEFVFINSGKEPLVINNCSASCGCTVPTWPRSPILPGAKGTILVRFDTRGKNGPFNKIVYIESNVLSTDPTKQKYELYIKGSVTPLVVAAPKTDPSFVVPVKH